MLNFGILGTGRMAVRLGDLAAKSGHRVVMGSRDPARAREIAGKLGERVTGGAYSEAAACDIVMPALFIRDGAFEILKPFAEDVEGKIAVDIFNPFNDAYDDFTLPWDTSAAEELQRIWPGTRIVSTFKWPFWEAFENHEFEGGPMDVIYTGNDLAAKEVVLELFRASPWRFLDGGGLEQARFTERMTLFSGQLAARYGYLPRVGWRLLGEPWEAGVKDAYRDIVQRWDRA
ncbi:NADPH-dependent F420 reductase [Methylocapsa acidiphila]|uniref:NADPH-dependent F420 reductase n=1 Tax=Methylocapsa acidiphila TaxID=133552 RepID=UPI0004789BC0|nr:NAD(P)-binding domain-containing protein [Methylocapsa acidiphila]